MKQNLDRFNIKSMKVNTRGGKRNGSGRKPTKSKKTTITIEITPEEKTIIKKLFPNYGGITRAFKVFITLQSLKSWKDVTHFDKNLGIDFNKKYED